MTVDPGRSSLKKRDVLSEPTNQYTLQPNAIGINKFT
jgi:hypothetical protein